MVPSKVNFNNITMRLTTTTHIKYKDNDVERVLYVNMLVVVSVKQQIKVIIIIISA